MYYTFKTKKSTNVTGASDRLIDFIIFSLVHARTVHKYTNSLC